MSSVSLPIFNQIAFHTHTHASSSAPSSFCFTSIFFCRFFFVSILFFFHFFFFCGWTKCTIFESFFEPQTTYYFEWCSNGLFCASVQHIISDFVCMHFHWLFARAFFFVRMHQLMFNHMKFTVNTVCIRALQFQYLAHFGFLYRASYQSENHSIIFNFIFHIVLKQIATSSINSSFFLVYCQIDQFNQTIHEVFWNFSFKKLENEKKIAI